MKSIPILFSASMVRALLEGSKTQTRRLKGLEDVNVNPGIWQFDRIDTLGYMTKKSAKGKFGAYFHSHDVEPRTLSICPTICPYGQPGNLLWVREGFDITALGDFCTKVLYKATGEEREFEPKPFHGITRKTGGKSSLHMPRWASRLTLELTEVRVERLQEIGEDDAKAQGLSDGGCLNCGESSYPKACGCAKPSPSFNDAFAFLWQSLHGQDSWLGNPWVWALSFRVHQQNVDSLMKVRAA